MLIVTPGAVDANSYATDIEADDYNASRPHTDDWTNATDDMKEAALIHAARLIDAGFVWTGSPTTQTQALTWPRVGMMNRNGGAIAGDIIPQELKNAQSELARQLVVADLTANDDAEKQNLESVSAGPVSISYQRRSKTGQSIDERDADIISTGPEFGWRARWMPDAVPLMLVPSWYERPLVSRPVVFRTYR